MICFKRQFRVRMISYIDRNFLSSIRTSQSTRLQQWPTLTFTKDFVPVLICGGYEPFQLVLALDCKSGNLRSWGCGALSLYSLTSWLLVHIVAQVSHTWHEVLTLIVWAHCFTFISSSCIWYWILNGCVGTYHGGQYLACLHWRSQAQWLVCCSVKYWDWHSIVVIAGVESVSCTLHLVLYNSLQIRWTETLGLLQVLSSLGGVVLYARADALLKIE